MTATVTRAGPYYTSGEEIKFSSLRANFRAQQRKTTSGGSETFSTDTGEIKVSDLKRITTTLETNPIVPDATENANISTSSNWKTSQFRGSIKYYYITQSGTNLNFDIDNPPTTGSPASWNANLNKNIQKFLFVDGTCGSNSVTIPAAQLNDAAYNLTVDVTGSILGAGGRGGSSSGNITSKTYTRIQLFRYYNPTTGDHYCTTEIGTPPPEGYLNEGSLGTVFKEQAPGTSGGYDNDDGDFSQSGKPYSGILGYVYSSSQPNTKIIYQLTNGKDTMWSEYPQEGEYTTFGASPFYIPTSDLTITSGEETVSYGENGGDALEMNSFNGANNIVLLRSSAKIYGGGGGGEKGATGAIGDTGTCWTYTYKSVGSGCNSCGDCGAGWERYGGCNDTGGCDCGGWWLWYGCLHQNKSDAECRQPVYTSVAGGAGGAGGNGGKGQGYDGNKTNGIEGVLGDLKTCSGYTGTGTAPGQGKKGETGGNGGNWGSPGGNTNNLGNSGSAGRAIVGTNYSVGGQIDGDTLKGLYKPQ
jgi:hypothetical protein